MYYLGVIGFVATTIGLSIGGLLALFLNRFQQSIATTYALCAGMILGLVYFDIAPESIEFGGWILFITGFLMGMFLFFIIHKASHRIFRNADKQNENLYIRTGLLLMISISIHNFPLGIAFGSSQNMGLSSSVLQTIILHNIPEGIAMFTPLFLAKLKFHASLLFAIIVSLPVGMGAILGSNIGLDHPLLWSLIISSAIGMIIIVTIKEIYFEALNQSSVAYSLIMTGIGILIIWVYLNGSTPKSVLELKKNTKKHLYPLKLRVRPNNRARYTDAFPFYQGFTRFTRVKCMYNAKRTRSGAH